LKSEGDKVDGKKCHGPKNCEHPDSAPMPVTQDVHVDARNRTSAISPESGAEGFQVMRGSSLRISGLSAMSADGASPNMRRNWLEK
jgi:hypothetical protein